LTLLMVRDGGETGAKTGPSGRFNAEILTY